MKKITGKIIKYIFYLIVFVYILIDLYSYSPNRDLFEYIVGFAVLYIADSLYFLRKEIKLGTLKIKDKD